MDTQVTFRSNKFGAVEGEEAELNPGVWGKRLAEHLRDRLPEHGLQPRCIGAEDWGWMVEIENPDFPLWVGCGHQDGEPDEFLCFINPDKPEIRKLFRKIDTRERIECVARALDAILRNDPEVMDLQWE